MNKISNKFQNSNYCYIINIQKSKMMQSRYQQPVNERSKRLTLLGFLILALQIGMLFAYGFAGKFSYISGTSPFENLLLPIYFYMTMFAVGLGLMLSFFGKGTALGLGTAIFTIALNIQLSPLLQKFWFDVFVGHFDQTTPSGNTDLNVQFQQLNSVYMSTIYQRNAIAMTISFLISCLATIGKTGLFEIFTSLIVFNVMWPIPFYCNMKLYYRDLEAPRMAFDDFGLTYIYTFAGFFGFIYSIFLNRKYSQNIVIATPSKTSTILSIFGTTIVFCTLPATVLLNPIPATNLYSNRINIGVLNIFFSEIASVISCVVFSLLFGKIRRFNVLSIIVSVLSGPAIVAQFGALDNNIGLYLTVGAFGGLLAAIWNQLLHPRFNRTKVQDAMSLIGSVLIPSFFGGIVVTPILYRIYIDLGKTTLTGVFVSEEYIRYQYIFYFITVGSAIFCGIIAGLFSFCTRSVQNDFTIRKMFSPDYGLCNNPTAKVQVMNVNDQGSAENFNRGQ